MRKSSHQPVQVARTLEFRGTLLGPGHTCFAPPGRPGHRRSAPDRAATCPHACATGCATRRWRRAEQCHGLAAAFHMRCVDAQPLARDAGF
eukprot:5683777-Prymnesium_polylepis.1